MNSEQLIPKIAYGDLRISSKDFLGWDSMRMMVVVENCPTNEGSNSFIVLVCVEMHKTFTVETHFIL